MLPFSISLFEYAVPKIDRYASAGQVSGEETPNANPMVIKGNDPQMQARLDPNPGKPSVKPSNPRHSRSYIVHLACGLVVVVVTEAGHRRHIVVVLTLGPRFIGRFFTRILLNVLCIISVLEHEGRGEKQDTPTIPLTFAS